MTSGQWAKLPLDIGILQRAQLQLSSVSRKSISLSSATEVIWAILLRTYTGSDRIVFGRIDDEAIGPENVSYSFTDGNCSKPIVELVEFRTTTAFAANDVQSMLWLSHNAAEESKARLFGMGDVAPGLQVSHDGVHVLTRDDMCYWHSVASPEHAANLRNTLQHLAETISCNPSSCINDLDRVSRKDFLAIQRWNSRTSFPSFISLPDMLLRQAGQRPDAQAMHAWDGKWTYRQLYEAANDLASCLKEMNAQQGDNIVFRVEKSGWAVAGMVAILIVGAVCVPVDVRHPVKRVKQIIEATKPKLLLVTKRIESTVFEQYQDLNQFILPPITSPRPNVVRLQDIRPQQAAFVFFTSGSTGAPKGVVQEHFALSVKVQQIAAALNQDAGSRTLQYSSFTFDPCVADIFGTFHTGGCLLVPSEQQRLDDLAGVVTQMQCTHLCVTATTLSTLAPDKVSCLHRVTVGGEAMTREQIREWSAHVHLSAIYGTTESVIWDTIQDRIAEEDSPSNIGRSLGPSTWIVDAVDTSKILPIGAVGELLIGGCSLARGYLNEPILTNSCFIDGLPQLQSFSAERLYRTGDLAQYRPDGSIQLLGRKDQQVKINGQRVELGEIEYALRGSLPKNVASAVDVVYDGDQGREPTLCAFVGGLSADLREIALSDLQDSMVQTVPEYMIPSSLVKVGAELPTTSSGKTDRVRLREIGGRSLQAQRYDREHSINNKGDTNTAAESKLLSLWIEVLKVKGIRFVDLQDDFFKLGGDSISAIKLVALARKHGLLFSVSDVFEQRTLSSLAATAKTNGVSSGTATAKAVVPFSLLEGTEPHEGLIEDMAKACHVPVDKIQDILPCTLIQEGLCALTHKSGGDYLAQIILELPHHVDKEKFQAAYDHVAAQNSILRTRFAHRRIGTQLHQVILDEEPEWRFHSSLDECKAHNSQQLTCEIGEPLIRCNLVSSRDGKHYFLWAIHHALYDEWSFQLMLDSIERQYHGESIMELIPLKYFLRHLTIEIDQDACRSFWQSELKDARSFDFPSGLPSSYQPTGATRITGHTVEEIAWPMTGFTPSTIIRAAWALLLSRYSSNHDVVFGVTVNGRQIELPGIERIAGPTFATIPLRVQLGDLLQRPVSDLLARIQQQATTTIPFEQYGLQSISRVSDDAEQACRFQTLLVIGTEGWTKKEFGILKPVDQHTWDTMNTYAITLEVTLLERQVQFQLRFDETALDEAQAESLLHQLEHVTRELVKCSTADRLVSEVDCVASRDKEILRTWSQLSPLPDRHPVTEKIAWRSRNQPDTIAIEFDGETLSYRCLNLYIERLAKKLKCEHGLHKGQKVLICSEKSLWCVLGFFGVLKAGGVCILLDFNIPPRRLDAIRNLSMPVLALVSKSQVGRFRDEIPSVLLGRQLFCETKPPEESSTLVECNLSDDACIVFTSGSTGVPKGIRWTHSILASSAREMGIVFGLSTRSRVFQYASYNFDVSIHEIVATLINGGCLCIPSEDQRANRMTDSFLASRANFINLTPSVAEIIEPHDLPCLKTVVFAGEPLSQNLASKWASRMAVFNWYGPAECSLATSCVVTETWRTGDIGRGSSTGTWIVDASDHHRLLPIGAVGELLLEGPHISPGYAYDDARTAASFVEAPVWWSQFREGPPKSRFYKTGDLVKYDSVGNLTYCGRNDSQVKLRGQRIELAEIEHHVRKIVGLHESVVADILETGQDSKANVCAFISDTHGNQELSRLSSQRTDELQCQLKEFLPSYMIPSIFLAIKSLPKTSTGKVDRKALRSLQLPASHMASKAVTSNPVRKSRKMTATEHTLCQLWQETLKLPQDHVDLDDDFFKLGGNSIDAMRLTASARREGFSLTVKIIMTRPKLWQQALEMAEFGDDDDHPIMPFSLLGRNIQVDELREAAAVKCNAHSQQIEDIFPCTPMQIALLALTSKRAGDYVSREVYDFSGDTGQFERAWQIVAAETPILRTRIIDLGFEGLSQIIVNESVAWEHFDGSLENYLKYNETIPMGLGKPLTRCALVRDPERSGHGLFVWTIHHALHDGWSFRLILEQVDLAYQNQVLKRTRPYQHFIKYVNTHATSARADNFWKRSLDGAVPTAFITLPSAQYEVRAKAHLHRHTRSAVLNHQLGATPTSIIRVAWALLLAHYVGNDDVIFGAIVLGRQVPLKDIETVVAPTIANVPIRMCLRHQDTVSELLDSVRHQAVEMIPFEQIGLHRIRRLSKEIERATNFETVVVIQPEDHLGSALPHSLFQHRIADKAFGDFNNNALMLRCVLQKDGVELHLQYDDALIKNEQANRILSQLEHVISQLCNSSPTTIISDIDLISPSDLAEIWQWNGKALDSIDTTIGALFRQRLCQSPDARAVDAWDGQLTYQELYRCSNRLARELTARGLKRKDHIALCFKKSMWAVVAIFAAVIAGGTLVMIESSQPEHRLQSIMSQVDASMIIASRDLEDLAHRLLPDKVVVTVSEDIDIMRPVLNDLPEFRSEQPVVNLPQDALYIVFTSGTTGKPKGVIVTHRNFCSFMHHRSSVLPYTSNDRILDGASWSFDLSWANVLYTLCSGACLCIPQHSKDIAGAIAAFRPTVMGIAPSAARHLDPDISKSLRTLVFGGEQPRKMDHARWANEKIDVFNSYGPAECTVSVALASLSEASSVNIGRGVGATMWVVDPIKPGRLAGIGGIGELWLEGPQVAQGYLGELENNRTAFHEDPPWLLNGPRGCGRRGRLYQTGDLVRYNSDGTLSFLGRRDRQTKLYGQRIELEEIERCIHEQLSSGFDIVVEVIILRTTASQLLVAFVSESGNQIAPKIDKTTVGMRYLEHVVGQRLLQSLPQHMCPSTYILMESIPRLVSGKIDRQKLRDFATLEIEDNRSGSGSTKDSSSKRRPSTSNEIDLQRLWAKTLNIAVDSIGADDRFFQFLGGDSISAMRLVGLAREFGISFTVSEVYMNPKLCDLAQVTKTTSCAGLDSSIPFQFYPDGTDLNGLKQAAATRCSVIVSQVRDIIPCTPLQEGFLASTDKDPESYTTTEVFSLREKIDLDRLLAAWAIVVQDTPVLQTRIVDLPDEGLRQVHIEAPFSWTTSDKLQVAVERHGFEPGLGKPLTQWTVVTEANGQKHLVWAVHHSLFDGWSIPLILRQVERAYHRERMQPLRSMQPFVHYLQSLSTASSLEFWSQLLRDCAAPSFPPVPSMSYVSNTTGSITMDLPIRKWPRHTNVTPSAWILAAWALLVGRLHAVDDVTFGTVTSGRQVPVVGISEIVGPTIATIPFRVTLDWSQPFDQFAEKLQKQGAQQIPFEHVGIQNLKRMNADTERACSFQTLLNIQHGVSIPSSRLWVHRESTASANFAHYPWILEVCLDEKSPSVRADFDENVVSRREAERLISQFKMILDSISQDTSAPLNTISLISENELKEIWSWNRLVPSTRSALLQDIIARQASRRSSAQAVDAWDGSWTYQELEDVTSRLAAYLQGQYRVGPGVLVTLCFEKSKWAVVALLSVMKAGGGFVLTDINHPEERLRTIVQQVNKSLVLSSRDFRATAAQLGDKTLVVDESCLSKLNDPRIVTKGRPQDPLYSVFTSGSTGTPKGAVISHENFCSAVEHHRVILQYSEDTRVLDFASYSFDIAVSNVLHCLAAGGCLCIPSESQRQQNLAEIIQAKQVTLVDLTPSVSRSMEPASVPSLRTLVLGGESATRQDILRWSPFVQVLNGIGQAECTVTTTMALMDPARSGTPGIGKGVGANTWIVDPQDHNRLTAIGGIGELLVEGPIVGQGYLHDEKKTSAAFIRDPEWLKNGCPNSIFPGRSGRLYKTGDLVRYADDGTLMFVGRKDAQTKIRGQRIELEEIEFQLWQVLGKESLVKDLAAQVILPAGSQASALAVFICPRDARKQPDQKDSQCQVLDFANWPIDFGQLSIALGRALTSAMIPSVYIPVDRIPLAPTGKTDRKGLQRIGSTLNIQTLVNAASKRLQKRIAPSTVVERQLQKLWAKVLDTEPDGIAANDTFLQHGGDSITAMRLASLGRESGLVFTTKDVMLQPTLSDLAAIAQDRLSRSSEDDAGDMVPFSLLHTDQSLDFLAHNVLPYLDYPADQIQDVFPVTDFQATSIQGAFQRPPQLLNYFFADFDMPLDLVKLQRVCHTLPQNLPIFRTVFIPDHGDSFLQVVLTSEDLSFQISKTDKELSIASEELCRQDWRSAMPKLGKQWARFMIVQNTKEEKFRLILRMSHAQYDGISLDSVWSTLAAMFEGIPVRPSTTFAAFVKYSFDQKELGLEYWRNELSGSAMTRFDTPTARSQAARMCNHNRQLIRSLTWNKTLPSGVTVATVLTGCWAAAIASFTGQSDVVFGRLVAGRAGCLSRAVASVAGPCLNIVPIRVRWDHGVPGSLHPREVLASIQRQQIEAIPYETCRLSDMAKKDADWPADTVYGSVFQCQNVDEEQYLTLADQKSLVDVVHLEFNPQQPWLLVKACKGEVKVQLFGTGKMMDDVEAQTLFDSFCAFVINM